MVLRLVTNAPWPWERQSDESQEEHDLFWLWVGRGTPALQGEILTLARARGWTQRAEALSRRLAVPSVEDMSASIEADIKRGTYWAVRHWALRAERDATDMAETQRALQVRRDVAEYWANAEASTERIDHISDDDFNKLLEASDLWHKKKVG